MKKYFSSAPTLLQSAGWLRMDVCHGRECEPVAEGTKGPPEVRAPPSAGNTSVSHQGVWWNPGSFVRPVRKKDFSLCNSFYSRWKE